MNVFSWLKLIPNCSRDLLSIFVKFIDYIIWLIYCSSAYLLSSLFSLAFMRSTMMSLIHPCWFTIIKDEWSTF